MHRSPNNAGECPHCKCAEKPERASRRTLAHELKRCVLDHVRVEVAGLEATIAEEIGVSLPNLLKELSLETDRRLPLEVLVVVSPRKRAALFAAIERAAEAWRQR